MTREAFDQQLARLQEDVLVLSSLVEEAFVESVDNLKRRDVAASKQLIKRNKEIANRRYAIELEALTLIATQQPMAGDMRRLAATLFIANELERIGDYAKGMCRVNIRIGDEPLMKPLIDIPRMAELGQQMIHRAMESFVQRDVELAHTVIAQDEAVDALHDQIYAELITLLFQDVTKIRQANLLLMAAHNLERAADRATNICERAIYYITGEMIDYGWENDLG